MGKVSGNGVHRTVSNLATLRLSLCIREANVGIVGLLYLAEALGNLLRWLRVLLACFHWNVIQLVSGDLASERESAESLASLFGIRAVGSDQAL